MAQNFGGEDQGILESFTDDLDDWEEKFLNHSNVLAGCATDMSPQLEEIFRGVHSLKGGGAFISEIDPRMGALTKYCHAYETFLHALRAGQIPLDGSMRELTCEALVFLADGIHTIREGGMFPGYSGLVDKFTGALAHSNSADSPASARMRAIGDMAEVIEEDDRLLIILRRDIRYTGESRDFVNALWILTSSASPATRIIYDFGERWRISSIVVGQIIALVPSFAEVAVLSSAHCEMTWRRFRFRELGVGLYPDLSAYLGARRGEASDAC